MRRRISVHASVGAIALYTIVALSPIPRAIARDRPEVSCYFRPPLFNFSAEYKDGHVLDFNVGASRDELLQTLVELYSERGSLAAACGRDPDARPLTAAESYVSPSSNENARSLMQRDVVCLHIPERKAVIFHFENEHVRSIEITIVRTELP